MIGLLLFLSWLFLITLALAAFDRLVYWEYAHYRVNWDKDGKPAGFFWTPPEANGFDVWGKLKGSSRKDQRSYDFWRNFRSQTARRRLSFNWFFSTPVWIRGDARARFRLYLWRGLTLLAVFYPCWPVLIDVIR
jgi:hypothetical protein